MDFTHTEQEALHRLSRYGAMPLGRGAGEVPTSAAIRLKLFGFATINERDGGQHVELTQTGRAFNHRTVR